MSERERTDTCIAQMSVLSILVRTYKVVSLLGATPAFYSPRALEFSLVRFTSWREEALKPKGTLCYWRCGCAGDNILLALLAFDISDDIACARTAYYFRVSDDVIGGATNDMQRFATSEPVHRILLGTAR